MNIDVSQLPLTEQLALMSELIDFLDKRRTSYGSNSFGYIGNQASSMTGEFYGEITCAEYDNENRYRIAQDFWNALQEHYPQVYADFIRTI